MARPRKFIQIEGRTVDGVSYHGPSKRYYIISQIGKRVYFRDWQKARTAHRAELLSVPGHNVALTKGEKSERLLVTLCSHKAVPR